MGDQPSRRKVSPSPTLTLAWLSTWWKRMENEKLTDKEVYRNENAKKNFKRYFSTGSVGHAVDTIQITRIHTNDSAKCTGQGSPFGGRGRKRYEHGGSDSPAKRRNKFKSLLDFWKGDQSDVENPEILGMTAENFTSTIEPSDSNIYKVDNCPDETNSLLDNGIGERGK